MARALLTGIIAILFSSCYDKGDCLVTNSNKVYINLLKQSDKTANALAFSSIEIVGVAKTIYNDTTASRVILPVDPTTTESTFILNYGDQHKKIKFNYRNETVIPTSDCGAFAYQKDLKIVETDYDTALIRVVNRQLLKNVPVNFEILF